jgi:hypothetical protein
MAKVGKNYPRLRLCENYRYEYEFSEENIMIKYEDRIYHIYGDVYEFLIEFFGGNKDGIMDFIEEHDLGHVTVIYTGTLPTCFIDDEGEYEGYNVTQFTYNGSHYLYSDSCYNCDCDCTLFRVFLNILSILADVSYKRHYHKGMLDYD